MSMTITPAVAPAHAVSRYELAFNATREALEALSADKLLPVNLDIPTIYTVVTGNLPELLELRPQLAQLPFFDLGSLDRLESCALTLIHAQSCYANSVATPEAVTELVAEALELRELLHADLTLAARHGLINGAALLGYRTSTSHRQVAFDVIGLCAMFREGWSKLAGKTPVEVETIERGEQLADRILGVIAQREQTSTTVNEAMVMRQRAFTLFVEAYDEVRRGVCYLRWHEQDADRIAPSLYAGRNNSNHRRRDEAAAGKPATPTPAPTPAPGPAHPEVVVPAGHPGANPFTA